MNRRGFLGALSAALVGTAVGVGMPLRRVRAEAEPPPLVTDWGMVIYEYPTPTAEFVLPVEYERGVVLMPRDVEMTTVSVRVDLDGSTFAEAFRKCADIHLPRRG